MQCCSRSSPARESAPRSFAICRAMRPCAAGPAVRPAENASTRRGMTSREIIDRCDRFLFPVYMRAPLALVRGEGTRVWDADGRAYLDFFSSTVVTALGHCPPAVVRAIEAQAHRILHVSNLHYSEPQARLAEL